MENHSLIQAQGYSITMLGCQPPIFVAYKVRSNSPSAENTTSTKLKRRLGRKKFRLTKRIIKIAPPAIARAVTSSPSVLRGWSIQLHAGVCCYSFEYID
ncbi:hypothetical protein C0J52_28284 [Blattella germanica]|nr:hypothetical protein C0J52_28284 [Blattella germanica]